METTACSRNLVTARRHRRVWRPGCARYTRALHDCTQRVRRTLFPLCAQSVKTKLGHQNHNVQIGNLRSGINLCSPLSIFSLAGGPLIESCPAAIAGRACPAQARNFTSIGHSCEQSSPCTEPCFGVLSVPFESSRLSPSVGVVRHVVPVS